MPSYSNLVVDQRLTNMSEMIKNDGYQLSAMLPTVRVKRDSDTYAVYGSENMNIPETAHGRGAKYNRVTWTVSNATYQIERYGLATELDEDDIAAADSIFDVRSDAAQLVTEMLMLDREKRMADLLTTSANYTNSTSLTSGSQWNQSGTDIVAQVLSGQETIVDSVVRLPNTICMGYKVYNAARENSTIKDRLGNDVLTKTREGDLRELLDVDRLIVSRAQYNSNNAADTASYSNYVFGEYALLAYVAPNPGRKQVSLGYTFEKAPLTVARWKNPHPDVSQEVVGAGYKADEVLTEEKCGYLIINTLA